MTTLQKSIVAAAITLAAGTGLYQAGRISDLERQIQTLKQPQAPGSDELEHLRANQDQASNRLAALQHENDQLPAKVRDLQQRFDQAPERKIPELALLKETDWLQAAKEANLGTEAGTRKAFNDLRTRAKSAFGGMLQKAFQKYTDAHNDELPPALGDLEPFFGTQNLREILPRYSYRKEGRWSELPAQEELVHVTAPRVDFYDSQVQVLKTAMVIDNPVLPDDENVLHVLDAFFAGNYAHEPKSLSELQPYAKTPEEREALKRLFDSEASVQETQ